MWYLYACTRVWINLSFLIKGKVNSERKWYYSLLMSIESNDKKDPNRKMLFVQLVCAHQWIKIFKKMKESVTYHFFIFHLSLLWGTSYLFLVLREYKYIMNQNLRLQIILLAMPFMLSKFDFIDQLFNK